MPGTLFYIYIFKVHFDLSHLVSKLSDNPCSGASIHVLRYLLSYYVFGDISLSYFSFGLDSYQNV